MGTDGGFEMLYKSMKRARIGAISRLKTLGRLPGRDGSGERVRDSSDQARDLRGGRPGPKRQALLEEEDGRATMLKWRQGGVGWLQSMRSLCGRSPGARKYVGTVGLLLWAPDGARTAGVGNPY
jgi:hypothetical protein